MTRAQQHVGMSLDGVECIRRIVLAGDRQKHPTLAQVEHHTLKGEITRSRMLHA